MKKWIYVIFPAAMLGLFCIFYVTHSKQAEKTEKLKIEKLAVEKAEKETAKKAVETKARLDAEKRTLERASEEAKKEADKRAKWDAETQKIKEDFDREIAEFSKLSKEAQKLDDELALLHKNKESLTRETFNTLKLVEKAKVEKRNAEIEVQRLTEMISKRATESALVKPPSLAIVPTKS